MQITTSAPRPLTPTAARIAAATRAVVTARRAHPAIAGGKAAAIAAAEAELAAALAAAKTAAMNILTPPTATSPAHRAEMARKAAALHSVGAVAALTRAEKSFSAGRIAAGEQEIAAAEQMLRGAVAADKAAVAAAAARRQEETRLLLQEEVRRRLPRRQWVG